ncbi:MAG: YggS family pyridoxal phosphate-dependent enzyme [Planctomycetes bacterium]|nr:YggS family pyridoxal phosphate-dependent enzyme [Planctomycetota bacterium]MCB9905205.1 YggS family pyridoxal phosphate-dependent enzyme [Planctomycetota bacterium]
MSRDLESSWRDVRARLDAACAAAGRATDEVRLLPVSKSVDVDAALALHALGAREFGENRVDELERKAARFAALGREARWHFIGNLQRNKARRVVLAADVIHSVSTPKLLEALARVAAEEGRRPEIYLEVHLSGEDEKQGFAEDELRDAVALAGASHELRLLGLMTMAPRPEPDDVEGRAARRTFERCAELARELATEQPGSFEGGVAQLSMGMTGDLEQAVAAGSTCVRVGSAIFAAGGDA